MPPKDGRGPGSKGFASEKFRKSKKFPKPDRGGARDSMPRKPKAPSGKTVRVKP